MTERNLRTLTWGTGLTFLACLAVAVIGWRTLDHADLNEHQAQSLAVAVGTATTLAPVALLAAITAASLQPSRSASEPT